MRLRCLLSLAVSLGALWSAPLAPVHADQAIYQDALQNGWTNWSWATVNFSSAAPAPVHAGTDAIAVNAGAYQALYLHDNPQSTAPLVALTFWINGGPTGGQRLQVQATLSGKAQTVVTISPLAANTWTQITIPISGLGVAGQTAFDGFWIQDTSGAASVPVFYVDDIALTTTAVVTGPVTIAVDAAANQHPISPLVYGVAYSDTASLLDLNAPLNRMGGNNTTRYNWRLNADNKANDYYFESIGDSDPTPGGRGDAFVASSQAGGAQAMLTIPTIGWVAKLGPGRGKLSSFSVAKYGAQASTDYWMSDAGNGIAASGNPNFAANATITGNDPNDADVPDSVDTEGAWISHLVGKWGTAASGGLRYYILDNEPSIWFATHRDVHPLGPKMDEIKNDILTYGARVKAADPSALVVAPEEWGWSGYFASGYDQQTGGQTDRAAHGGMDYLPWLLQQISQHDLAAGQRTLDVFSVHFYPQGGEFSSNTDAGTDGLRNRSTRQLWDPNYTSESWIGAPVQLIPRLKGWVNSYYPGTKIGLTEYNWGAEGDINGATTQADLYGIFGREGLDLATRWVTPAANTPTYAAMKMYRNYDGQKSGFGDVSVSDTAPNPDTVSSFASVRSSDGALTVMVINKQIGIPAPLTLTLSHFAAATAQVWQLTSTNAITRLADAAVAGRGLTLTVPAQSITLLVFPPAAATPAPVTVTPAADTYVRSAASAAQNFGTQTSLQVKKILPPTNPFNRVSYLKFDLTGVSTAPKTATLSLTLSAFSGSSVHACPCKLYGIAASGWAETGLTWNAALASEGLTPNITGSGTLVTSTPVGPHLGVYTWDVSSYLKDKAGQVVTLQVIDESGANQLCTFNSKEAATGKPSLTLTF